MNEEEPDLILRIRAKTVDAIGQELNERLSEGRATLRDMETAVHQERTQLIDQPCPLTD